MAGEAHVFAQTFQFLDDALGARAFKRWNGHAFVGKFLMSVFEVLATGVSFNVRTLSRMPPQARNAFIERTARSLWSNDVFIQNSGAGIRVTTRLTRLLPIARQLLEPGHLWSVAMPRIRTLTQLQEALDAEMGWRLKEIATFKVATKTKEAGQKVFVRAGLTLIYAH
jgi:hypothetical protein